MRSVYPSRGLRALAFAALLTPFAVSAQSTSGLCGTLDNAFGPFDYRTARPDQKRLVEGAHFTPAVETLRHGKTGRLGGDIDYTLRAFPNHPRALLAMTRLGEREGGKPPGARYPVECYYDRAVRFQPDDAGVRVLYAIYLIERKRVQEARFQLERAESGAEKDAQVAYNLGLAYFNLGEFKRSQEFARRAYALGVRAPALRDKLKSAGHWSE